MIYLNLALMSAQVKHLILHEYLKKIHNLTKPFKAKKLL